MPPLLLPLLPQLLLLLSLLGREQGIDLLSSGTMSGFNVGALIGREIQSGKGGAMHASGFVCRLSTPSLVCCFQLSFLISSQNSVDRSSLSLPNLLDVCLLIRR